MVQFKSLADFPGYRVGDDGSVWSCWRLRRRLGRRAGFESYMDTRNWRRMRLVPDKDGYLMVKMQRGAKQHTRKVARLVLELFVGSCPEGMQSCHNDGVKTNNAVSNLRWDTREGNERDKLSHGTRLSGEKMPTAKLTRDQVVEIHRRRAAGETLFSLATKYGVAFQHIGQIVTGKRWREVYEEVAKVRN